jgi:pimeloyl-ACP methyl ester carboxylesterase
MKRPLLLLPGTLCDARLWAHQVAAFGRARQVLLGDLTQDETIARMAERVLAAAPPRFALAGLSLGGIVALEVIRRAPKRVDRLALLDTTARPPTVAQREYWQALSALATTAGLETVVRERLLPSLLTHNGRNDPEMVAMVEAMARDIGSTAYQRQLRAVATRVDSRPYLASIDCPVLVLAGQDDAVCPPELHEEIVTAIPSARLVLIPHCGHLSTLERPRAVTEALHAWLVGIADQGISRAEPPSGQTCL